MEKNVDIINYNSREMVVIKQPGTARLSNGDPLTKIEMSVDEACILYTELTEKLALHLQARILRG